MRKIHSNEIQVKLGHPVEYRIRVTVKHIHYIVKGGVYVYEDCATDKSRKTFLHEVAED